MERIKEALDKAREQRERGSNGSQHVPRRDSASGSRLGQDRILEREPFNHYSSVEQRRLLESGRILNVGAGETLQFAGDQDAYVHYLLSGAVVIESGHETQTVAADQANARLPLDAAGVKRHTITAASDAEVFRVPDAALPREIDAEDEAPVPASAYTETFSGRQLADLVGQINAEYAALDRTDGGAVSVDPSVPLGEDMAAATFGELSASAESLLADLGSEFEQEATAGREPGYTPAVDDELGRATRELESRFRRHVDGVKAAERSRYDALLQKHAERLQQLAEQRLRTKLSTLRERTHDAYQEKERRLRDRYKSLRAFANRIGRQKAAIYVARRQINEKLQGVERAHRELAQLGRQISYRLDDLDDLMPRDKGATRSGG